MKKVYRIEILSPLHIGNGNKINPIEYLLDEKFYRIDMDSLFKDENFAVNKFIEKANKCFYLGDFYPNIAKQHIKYSLEISEELKKKKKIKEIHEFIKSGGRVYIPGSSIKGAIRTALLYYAIKNDEWLFNLSKNHVLQLSIIGGNKKKADDVIEEKFFGRITHDFMKALIISDSNLKSPSCLKLQLIKAFSINIADKPYQKLDLLAECIKIGSEFKLDIKLEDFYFKEARELGFSSKKKYLDNLPQICNEYSKELIDYELKFYRKYKMQDLVEFYEKLDAEKGFLLRISWGSGWHSMSIARIFQEEPFFMELRKRFNLGKRRNYPYFVDIFPKSRKVVFDDKIYPLGWIKLEEIK